MELSKVRIQGVRKSEWNGELLSQMRSLVSIAQCQDEEGTLIQVKGEPTTNNMKTSLYTVPPEWCCISVFRNLRKCYEFIGFLTRHEETHVNLYVF